MIKESFLSPVTEELQAGRSKISDGTLRDLAPRGEDLSGGVIVDHASSFVLGGTRTSSRACPEPKPISVAPDVYVIVSP
jgi:hypothetical protein